MVRSNKDRRIEELEGIRMELNDACKEGEWSTAQAAFDKMNKAAERARRQLGGHLKVYIRSLFELEEVVAKALEDPAEKKKLNATQAKALTALRQRVRKQGAPFQAELEKCKADPTSFVDRLDADMGEEEIEREKAKAREAEAAAAAQKRDEIFSMDPKDITFEVINSKLRDLKTARGKKGVSRSDLWELIVFVGRHARGPAQQVTVLLQMLSMLFDVNPSMASHLPPAVWRKAFVYVSRVLDILEAHPSIKLDEAGESFEERTAEPGPTEDVRIPGNLMAIVERMDDELFKALQQVDPHTNEYLDRLKDETLLLAVAARVSVRLGQAAALEARARVDLRRIEHYYYKTVAVYEASCRNALKPYTLELEAADRIDTAEQAAVCVSLEAASCGSLPELIRTLTSSIYNGGDERCKARALLCCVYHKALMGDFYGARDLLLMSHLSDNISHMDVETQILYNRSLAQLGLAAFRKGLFQDSFQSLQELYLTGRTRELLAQGQSQNKGYEKTPEQEALERRRLVPFHMHINLELLESVHLVCCMLLEVPNLARNGKPGVGARYFSKILDSYSRMSFLGPPDTVRDHITAATRALLQGDWRSCQRNVQDLPCWGLLREGEKEHIEQLLQREIKRVALKTYLLCCSQMYMALELDQLATMFDLTEQTVAGVIGSMIANEELAGSLDSSSKTVVLSQHARGPLHEVAKATLEKVSVVVDLNERAYTYRSGGLRTGDDEDGPQRTDDRFSGENRRGRARGGRGLPQGALRGQYDRRGGGRGGRGGQQDRNRGGDQQQQNQAQRDMKKLQIN